MLRNRKRRTFIFRNLKGGTDTIYGTRIWVSGQTPRHVVEVHMRSPLFPQPLSLALTSCTDTSCSLSRWSLQRNPRRPLDRPFCESSQVESRVAEKVRRTLNLKCNNRIKYLPTCRWRL
ncbi:hypothetical protein TGVAND_217724 [Toxoplasma gondii VAND]|uniref:Uncharacterized protein n=1 Tax=Toxoplasma gondii VAND TaxID=933077 RepID=A0A086PY96_TOXGO|nr:hypothetical protein TGVAND_217724 [Toxoplasma gondii VAND]